MPDSKLSPAVVSLRNEQTQQTPDPGNADLDTGLADTFPASDPVSATHTSTPAVTLASEVHQQDRQRTSSSLIRGVEKAISERPIAAVAVVAALAFVFGATR